MLLALAIVFAWPLTAASAAAPAATATNAAAPAAAANAVPPAPAVPAPAPSAPAPPAAAAPIPPPTLAQLAGQAQITSNDNRLAVMEQSAAAIETQARTAASGSEAQAASLQRRIAAVVPRGRRTPTAAEKTKLAPLQAQLAGVQNQLAQQTALANQAEAVVDQIAERRREGFSARVLTRSPSPVAPEFWSSLAGSAAGDWARLGAMANDEAAAAEQAPEPRAAIGFGVVLALALALVLLVRRWLEKLGRRKSGDAVHPGLARTGAALWIVAVDTGVPTLAAAVLHAAAQWGGLLSVQADALAGAAVGATAWACAILALGRVMATDRDPRQRLIPLNDAAAGRLRLPLRAVAAVTGAGFLFTKLNYVIGASVAATIAANCVLSIAYAAVAGLILVSFGVAGGAPAAGPKAVDNSPPAASPIAQSPAWTLASLVLGCAIVVTLGAVLAGYTTLAAITSGQIFWLSIIAGVTWLVTRFIDDLTTALFSERGWGSRLLYSLFGLRRGAIGQVGVLVSAALQLMVLVGALSLALTPFGRGGDLLLANLGRLAEPIKFGSATISPSAVLAGIVTFVLGMGVARMAQRWVVRRYLPVTDWDSGVRNSVSTGVGYLGVVAAILCALSATGLGLSQIALVASALSVGIGFGLQNVVQNFVSGLILLIERPVKVGDWISIDSVEGDVRRIRVRATEIQTPDKSTVIVPNSDLITKAVQNRTLGEPSGRIKLQLSITRAADVRRARALILKVAVSRPEIAKTPAPEVYIESLAAAGAVNLTCFFYVHTPRDAYKVRSACYFEILDALQHDEIAFAG
jgi:small-conductance mechanosensitive channel